MYGLPDIRLVGTDLSIRPFRSLAFLAFLFGDRSNLNHVGNLSREEINEIFFFNCNESIRIKNSNILSFKHLKDI